MLLKVFITREIKEEKIVEIELPEGIDSDIPVEELHYCDINDYLEKILDPDPEGELSFAIEDTEKTEEALLPDREISVHQLTEAGFCWDDLRGEIEDDDDFDDVDDPDEGFEDDEVEEDLEEDKEPKIYNKSDKKEFKIYNKK
jgi:hypothetical protein